MNKQRALTGLRASDESEKVVKLRARETEGR